MHFTQEGQEIRNDVRENLRLSWPESIHRFRIQKSSARCIFCDRIFKGAKPADLPFEQPTKFELVINGRTTEALSLKIPRALLISVRSE